VGASPVWRLGQAFLDFRAGKFGEIPRLARLRYRCKRPPAGRNQRDAAGGG
jgi:hypothetical protein